MTISHQLKKTHEALFCESSLILRPISTPSPVSWLKPKVLCFFHMMLQSVVWTDSKFIWCGDPPSPANIGDSSVMGGPGSHPSLLLSGLKKKLQVAGWCAHAFFFLQKKLWAQLKLGLDFREATSKKIWEKVRNSKRVKQVPSHERSQ